MIRAIVLFTAALALLPSLHLASAQPCVPSLSPEFAADPLDFAPAAVNAFIDFNDGSGFKTYACGSFRTAGGQPANTVARWNGIEWQPVPEAPIGIAKCFAIFNNTLYMGGSFGSGDLAVPSIFRWSGSAWLPMTDGPRGASVNAMTVWNDGSGPALFAVGNFSRVGASATIRAVVKFNGTSWSQLGQGLPQFGGLPHTANAVIAYDDGLGPALYVGGQFGPSGSSTIARWDRLSWNMNTGPNLGPNGAITAFHTFADSQGPALWAAAAPQFSSPILFRYGSSRSWSPVQIPIANSFNQAYAIASYNDGTGNALYLGGDFLLNVSGGLARNLAKFNGTTWSRVSTLGSDIFGPITALAVRTGTRVGLLAGGIFQIGTQPINSVALWNGIEWSSLASGLTSPGVQTIAFSNAPDSSALHAFGSFTGTRRDPQTPLNHAARWSGDAWIALGPGINGVRSAAFINDTLYAAGSISIPGQSTPTPLVRWDGTSWIPATPFSPSTQVTAITAFDDGSGPVPCIAARLGGSSTIVYALRNDSWTPLGSPFPSLATILMLKQLPDGGLYAAGGALQGTQGLPNERTIAKWDGLGWLMLPSGPLSYVYDIELFDGALYAAGQFSFFASETFQSATLARLDQNTWTYPTAGRAGTVQSLAVWNDGSGDALYLAGNFLATDLAITNLARFRNAQLQPFSAGTNATIQTLRVHADDLYAAGLFTFVGADAAPGIARWSPCPRCPADFDNGAARGTRDGGVTIDDLLFFLALFADGNLRADLDDGSSTGTPDGGVTMEDLTYYLTHYVAGC